ncbi:MAG: glycosyltransferase [Ktedonobacterales bacterium]
MISLHTSPLAQLGRTRDAGGMNVYIRGLARELGSGSMYVDIFTRRTDPSLPPIEWLNDQVRLIHIPAGPETNLPPSELFPYVEDFMRRVAHFSNRQEHDYDIVHSHYWLSAVAGLSLAHLWDVPHVTMFHTVERLKGMQYGHQTTATAASLLRMEREGHIAASVDQIVVSTEHEREQLHKLYGLPYSLLSIIPCGVDLEAFSPGSASERLAARTLVAPGSTPMLLFVGRLDPIKGLDLLLESVALMRTPARLTIVGGNPAGDPEVERLRERARELGLRERVFFPGAVPQTELCRYYRAADALVVASRYESFGLAAVESLACGTPVAAAQVGGLPSIVREGENGILVRWRCPEYFAERLDALLADSAGLARMSAHARSSVQRFDWRRIGDKVRTLYQQLTAEQRDEAACCCF